MAYIGQQPFQEFTSVPTKDSFTGDGSTTTFDLANDVVRGSENALEVFVDNVRQEPGSGKAFTMGVDGSNNFRRITFSAAPANGASIYVINDKTSNTSLIRPTDLNGVEFILDADADTSITADTDDRIDIKIAGSDHFAFLGSSGDTVIKPLTDAKDIIFQQYDGTSILEINDGAYAKFTAAAIAPEATLTDASTITINALTQSVSKVTLGANRTIAAPSGSTPAAGQFIALTVIQDGTGSRTLTWNAVFEFTGDSAPTATTTASKGDMFTFRYNGSKWLEVGRNLNLTLS